MSSSSAHQREGIEPSARGDSWPSSGTDGGRVGRDGPPPLETFRHDAIVLGGGPAGAVTAWHLARRGLDVILIERRDDTDPKCCGHCLHPDAMEYLDAMGCGDIVRRTARGRTRRGVLIVRGDRVVLERRFEQGGLVVTRRTLDPLLRVAAADAGAEVRTGCAARIATMTTEGTMVELSERTEPPLEPSSRTGLREEHSPGPPLRTGIKEEPSSRTGTKEWHFAPLIVGADGVGSAVARVAGLIDREVIGRKFGFSMSLPASPRKPASLESAVAMFVERDGYLGVVHEGDVDGGGRLHCAALLSARATIPTRPLDGVAWFAERSPLLREALGASWRGQATDVVATGPLPWLPTARAAPGVALVGDAAGYVEPFTGEGMRWALQSAFLLADAWDLDGWGAVGRAEYERAWGERIGTMHRRCKLVATLVASPSLVGALGCAVSAARKILPRFSDAALGPLVRKLVAR
jgi:flavin-dependent dehydrogenase